MGVGILREYVRLMVAEAQGSARVPTQLMPPEENDGNVKAKDEEVDDVEEMSACAGGAVSGYTAPLGRRKK